jgi:hypothetical protein
MPFSFCKRSGYEFKFTLDFRSRKKYFVLLETIRGAVSTIATGRARHHLAVGEIGVSRAGGVGGGAEEHRQDRESILHNTFLSGLSYAA